MKDSTKATESQDRMTPLKTRPAGTKSVPTEIPQRVIDRFWTKITEADTEKC